MGKTITQRFKAGSGFFRSYSFFLVLLASVLSTAVKAQTTIMTTGTDYTATNSGGSPGAITFAIQNSGTAAITLTGVASYLYSTDASSAFTLWYQTQLTGAPTISTAGGWTQITTGSSITPPTTNGIATVLSGMTFSIPANTTYRFALTSASSTIHYSGSSGAPASPNSFTSGSVSLLVSDNTTAPGYGGTTPSPANTPRAFTGSITYTTGTSTGCTGKPAAGITSNATTVCPNTPFNLTATPSGTSGLSYQFQVSTNSGASWTNTGTSSTNPTYSVASQTTASQYRVIVTCSNSTLSDTSAGVSVAQTPSTSCYCSPSASSTTYYIASVATTGGFVNINNVTNAQSPGGYGVFLSQVVSQNPQGNVSFTVNHGPSPYDYGLGVWVDWNQNGSFLDAGEKVYTSPSGTYATSHSGTFQVPFGATIGSTRIRFGQDYLSTTGPSGPCNNGPGEFEDYTFNVIALTPCAGKPAAVLTSSAANACPNVPFTLTSTPNGQSGLSYLYQNNTGSGWTNLAAASASPSYTIASQTVTTQYRVIIACSNSSLADTSAAVTVTQNPATSCYCTPGSTYANYYISTFSTTGGGSNIYNNTGGQSPGGYGQFLSQSVSQMQSTSTQTTSVNFNALVGPSGYYYGLAIWVDWNQNGSFLDAGEKVYNTTSQSPNSISGFFNVPANAALGNTRMRVGVDYLSSTGPSGPCATISYGEFEDYTFTVVPYTVCAGTPVGGTATANPAAVCPNTTSALSVVNSTLAANLTYQWQVYDPVTSMYVNVSNGTGATTSSYITGPIAVTSQYRVNITCTNSGVTTPSAPVTVTVNTYAPPYSETFESITSGGQFPNCMSASLTGNTYTGWYTYAANGSGSQMNHTPGGSKFANMYYYNTNAWLFTPGISLQGGKTYQFKFWHLAPVNSINFSAINIGVGTSATAAAMTIFGSSPTPNSSVYQQDSFAYVCTTTGVYNFGINGVSGTDFSGSPGLTVDDIQIIEFPPCTGRPSAGTIVRNTTNACPGTRLTLSLAGGSLSSGVTYQWQDSSGGVWNNITTGGNSNTYLTPLINNTTYYYRLIIKCVSSGLSDTSAVHTVAPYLLPLPYFETFESITANNQLPNCMQATNFPTITKTYTTATNGLTNHTPGGSKYGYVYGYNTDDWFFTSKIPLAAGKTYRLTYWYRGSGTAANVQIRSAVGSGPNAALMSYYFPTVTGVTATYAQSSSTAVFRPGISGNYVFGVNVVSSYNYIAIDDILVEELPQCTGAPNLTITPQDSVILCPTANTILSTTPPVNSGLKYQWQYSLDPNFPAVPAGTVMDVGTDDYRYSQPSLPVTAYYRLKTYCINGASIDSAYSNKVKVIINQTQYAPLPYVNDFETWVDYCDTKDVPSGGNWVQLNKTGNSSWRRSDQGSTAGWTNPTGGAYNPIAKSGLYSGRFHASSANATTSTGTTDEARLDMYINCNGSDTNKTLYFYQINPQYVNTLTSVSISTDAGLTFNQLASFDTASTWRLRVVPFQSDRPATILRFTGRRTATTNTLDVGIDSVYVAPPCVGRPTAGTITTNSPTNVCPGDTAVFNLSGTSFAGNLNIIWEVSTTSATAGFNPYQTTFGNYRFVTPPLLQTSWIRARVVCRGSGLDSISNTIQLNATTTPTPAYAALPFLENFESWTSRCSNSDIPSANWTNVPISGNRSWRRNDQGNTAGWSNLLAGQWWPGIPAAAVDTYCARFHNAAATPDGSRGTLYSYVNCSTVTGTKELRFFVNMPNRTAGNTDSLQVAYSRDGGLSFTRIGVVKSTNGWEQKVLSVPSDSAKTVIRFQATSQTTQQDIGIDYVQVLPPCSGAPIAGTVDSVADVCPSRPFRLSVSGISQSGNLAYTWERSTTGPTTGFSAIAGGTTPYFTTSITQNTWFRLRVRCGTDSTYTAARLVKLASFYYCYCITNPQYPITATQFEENIGNVTIRNSPSGNVLLNNGVGSPVSSNPTAVNGYSNFQNLPAPPMYRDSTYRIDIQQISYSVNNPSTVYGWLDFNRDGVFDPVTERIANLTTSSTTSRPFFVTGTFQVPSNATPGLTGLRLTMMSPTGTPAPCGTNPGYGETEDYLVELRFAPCSGFTSVNGGTAYISDSSICLGYPVTLWDTSYQKEIYGITRQWQRSQNNGASWQNIGTPNTDTISVIVQANSLYRYTMFCNNGAQSYSNVVSATLKPSTQCYCPSFATGGADGKKDSTDIGLVSIGDYNFTQGGAGPHLLNPASIRKWTNHAGVNQTIHLWADSNYNLDVYQIIRGATHKDAKVTVFIDYNQDLSFQVNPPAGYPSERILTAYTSATNYYLDNMPVHIPAQQIIQNVPTLMRVIINENTAANTPSDEGCGTYESGETEDFQVIFHCKGCPLGVSNASNVTSFNLFPNPTTGTSKLELNTQTATKEVELTITTMTGQVLQKKTFSNVGTRFETVVDLKEHARGVYFVELKADNERIVRKLVVQ